MPAGPSYRPHDPQAFVQVLAEVGLHLANPTECNDGREIAAELISPFVALAATFRRVQAYTVCAVSVCHDAEGAVSGVLGMVPIRPEGLSAIENNLFDPKNPPEAHLCAPGEPFACIYGWGFAARGRKASATVVRGAMALRDRFPDAPVFTRAATPAGAKVIRGRMGYVPFPRATDDLLWNPVRSGNEERAA